MNALKNDQEVWQDSNRGEKEPLCNLSHPFDIHWSTKKIGYKDQKSEAKSDSGITVGLSKDRHRECYSERPIRTRRDIRHGTLGSSQVQGAISPVVLTFEGLAFALVSVFLDFGGFQWHEGWLEDNLSPYRITNSFRRVVCVRPLGRPFSGSVSAVENYRRWYGGCPAGRLFQIRILYNEVFQERDQDVENWKLTSSFEKGLRHCQ